METNSKAAIAVEKKRGKPFQKGEDPRRHKDGSKSKAAIEFSKTLRQLLVSEGEKEQTGTIGENTLKLKKVEWLVKSVWKKAIDGEAWAVNFIAERVEGKVAQNFDGNLSGEVTIKYISHIPQPDKKPDETEGND